MESASFRLREDTIPLYVFDGEREVEEEGRIRLLSLLQSPRLTLMNNTSLSFLRALKDAREKGLKRALFIADTSASASTAEIIVKVIDQSMKNKPFDLLYLCKWMDRSNLYTERQSLLPGLSMVRSYAPRGVQAILFQATGMDKVLDLLPSSKAISLEEIETEIYRLVRKSYLHVYCTVPNVLQFDVLRAASFSDYDRLREADVPQESNESAKIASNTAYLWFVLIALIIVIVLWVLFKMERGH